VYLGYIGVFLDDAFKISMSRERETPVQISAKVAKYTRKHTLSHTSLVPWPFGQLIILFSEMLKFSKIISSKSKNNVKEKNTEY